MNDIRRSKYDIMIWIETVRNNPKSATVHFAKTSILKFNLNKDFFEKSQKIEIFRNFRNLVECSHFSELFSHLINMFQVNSSKFI